MADVLTKSLTFGDFSRCQDRMSVVAASSLFSDTGSKMLE